jgi:hypothetical protein
VIPGGNIRSISLRLQNWGGEGSLEFIVQDDTAFGGKYSDELCSDFVESSLMAVHLKLSPGHTDVAVDSESAPIETSGIAVERSVTEQVVSRSLGESSVLMRRYRLSFLDPARAIWQGHFPCGLHTQASFKSVLETHKGPQLQLEYDWDAVDTELPQIFYQLAPRGPTSFYDWVIWYVAQRGGLLTFDHREGTYCFRGNKPELDVIATLRRDDIAEWTTRLCDGERHRPRIRNSCVRGPRSAAGQNPNAIDDLYHDVILHTPIARDVDDALGQANATVLAPRQEVQLEFVRYPPVSVIPGLGVELPALRNGNSELLGNAGALRVVSVTLSANATDSVSEKDYGEPEGTFLVSMSCLLEDTSDTFARLPAVANPAYPGHLEGSVVCEIGEEPDVTYDYATDDESSLSTYRVRIPLFEDQEVRVPFEPTLGTANVYFPLYKGQRVLVALTLSTAWIERLLEWRPELLTAKERQGQQLFFGKSKESCTSLLHDYDDGSPVLQLLRTNKKDCVLLRLEEGRLLLKVEEQKD